MQKNLGYKIMTKINKIVLKCRVKMVSIILAFPNSLEVHQYYPPTPTPNLLGSSVKWVGTMLQLQKLRFVFWASSGTCPTSVLRCGHTPGNQTLTQGGSPTLRRRRKGSWLLSSSLCPDPTSHTDPGHTSWKKMEGRCIFPRSRIILP